MNNLSQSPTILWISSLILDILFLRIDTVITFLVVPQAVPKAFFDGTKTYGTFWNQERCTFYSQRMGRCNTISRGLASAAMMMSSVIPLLRVLVASLAPFLICLREAHWATKSLISEASYSVAKGWALSEISYINDFLYHFDIVDLCQDFNYYFITML